MNKIPILYKTLIINELNCDSFCAYCYLRHGNRNTDSYYFEGDLSNRVHRILDYTQRYYGCPIVRITGGEIFLMKNIKTLLDELLSTYPYVMIQTNFRLVDQSILEYIVQSKRILLQISIDGHKADMNKLRLIDDKLLKKMLSNIAYLKKNNVLLDITCTINKFNIRDLEGFINYCIELPSERDNNMNFTPLLLIDGYDYDTKNNKYLESIISKYDLYSSLLPPLLYMTDLLDKKNGIYNKDYCYSSKTCLMVTDKGDFRSCMCTANALGNILSIPPHLSPIDCGYDKIQNKIIGQSKLSSACDYCWNFSSVFNMYFNNRISLEELCAHNHMCNIPIVKQALYNIKANLLN